MTLQLVFGFCSADKNKVSIPNFLIHRNLSFLYVFDLNFIKNYENQCFHTADITPFVIIFKI
ncbi:TPA: hypothetical protein DEA20_04365 [Candidatus Dependentiae bacterium]|nr:hypothetical protein [Candidatus Dependentiae bacterium]